MDNSTATLTEKERMYLEHDESVITIPSVILRSIAGVFILILSAFVTPSAEGKIPFSSFFSNTRKRIKFTRYRKAVKRKLSGDTSEKNTKLIEKINDENFALDDPDEKIPEDEEIQKIYDKYMEEHSHDKS